MHRLSNRSVTLSHCTFAFSPVRQNDTVNVSSKGLQFFLNTCLLYLGHTVSAVIHICVKWTIFNTSLFSLLGDLPLSNEGASPCNDAGSSDEEEDDKDDVQSQGSSASSEDYIIILPECFDTSRPLGESMYSSALSQPSLEKTGEPETGAGNLEGGSQPQLPSVSDILTASQTLAVVPLTPETADTLPQTQR